MDTLCSLLKYIFSVAPRDVWLFLDVINQLQGTDVYLNKFREL